MCDRRGECARGRPASAVGPRENTVPVREMVEIIEFNVVVVSAPEARRPADRRVEHLERARATARQREAGREGVAVERQLPRRGDRHACSMSARAR